MKILHNNRSFRLEDFDVNDFEFMDVHGKKATVPTCDDNHQFTGKSIKQLAGVGAVYIRLTKKIPSHVVFISDDLDFEPLTKIRSVILVLSYHPFLREQGLPQANQPHQPPFPLCLLVTGVN